MLFIEDVECDFSVFYRIDDIFNLEGPMFFARAFRLFSYPGAVKNRLSSAVLEEERERKTAEARWNGRLNRSAHFDLNKREDVDSSPLAGLIEFGSA